MNNEKWRCSYQQRVEDYRRFSHDAVMLIIGVQMRRELGLRVWRCRKCGFQSRLAKIGVGGMPLGVLPALNVKSSCHSCIVASMRYYT